MPAMQLLIYPSVDLAMSHASVEEFAAGFFLTRGGMSWFRSHYLESPAQAQEPNLVFLENDLSGLAPAHVITAGFDPLRDEGKAFADRLAEFGVPVEHVCYTDMIHAFVSFAGGIPAGMQAIEDMSRALQQALAP
jgi:acetyl esterase